MKAIAKLFETMLTKDATPTWGHQTGTAGATAEDCWGWGGAPETCWGWGGVTD